MLKIGDFSKMSRVTIKALRYYEKEGLVIPTYIDESNSYRYYDSSKLLEISRLLSLKQIGLSIDEIKKIMIENEDLREILENKKSNLEKEISKHKYQLSQINYLLKENDMKKEVFEKVVPSYFVYYKEGVVKDYSEIGEFIYNSGLECKELNPNIKCVEPDYCYINYLDGEYKEKNIKVRYAQAVIKDSKPFKESKTIKFEEIPETKCICIYHKGSYDRIGESYSKILKYIEDNKLKMDGFFRESYIDGVWNKENPDDYLTEIQIPIK